MSCLIWLLNTGLTIPIFIGNPAGICNVIKSFNFLKCALLADIKSIIGTTCSCKESGKFSHSHNVALNFCVFVVWSIGRPISRVPSSTRLLKYSSGVIWHGLLDVLEFSWKSEKQIYVLMFTCQCNILRFK